MGNFSANEKAEGEIISDIKRSTSIVGRLYPVLVDSSGRVIDGAHRLKADPTWFKVEVPNMESEEHRLLARLISNVCRRKVPSEEKTKMLDSLGQFYLEQGVPHSELVRKIVQNTGMSYRWVMKYSSDVLKVRPGLGGPRSQKAVYENEVARRATDKDKLLSEPSERIANLTAYSNTNFATILIEKRFYSQLKGAAAELGVDINIIINNTLLMTLQRIKQLIKHEIGSAILVAAE
ncbi:MAG: hypothetical protein ABSA75_12275 [Candidatus Bathyarchaeia archaeon]